MKQLRSSKSTALVTGAAKRLGRAVAVHLASQGFNIALHYNRSKAEAMETAMVIHKKGVHCELFACDLGDEAAVSALLPKVRESFPNLNMLVNSASIFVPNKFDDRDLTLFKAHWDINYKAPYILSCAFSRLVKQGHIINFIDANVAKHASHYADYLTTKKALYEFTQMAAVQWGPKIRVNGISPGMILPPVSRQDDRKKRAGRIPLKRVGDPKYVLQALQFLLENDYLTGQIIAVDGGEQLV